MSAVSQLSWAVRNFIKFGETLFTSSTYNSLNKEAHYVNLSLSFNKRAHYVHLTLSLINKRANYAHPA